MPVIMIGQDESIFRQYAFTSKTWNSPDGTMKLLPKSDGHTQMVSVFVARPLGLGIYLSSSQLGELNESKRKKKSYISTES